MHREVARNRIARRHPESGVRIPILANEPVAFQVDGHPDIARLDILQRVRAVGFRQDADELLTYEAADVYFGNRLARRRVRNLAGDLPEILTSKLTSCEKESDHLQPEHGAFDAARAPIVTCGCIGLATALGGLS